jgi:nucleotide-binding universal stress UspA family protein
VRTGYIKKADLVIMGAHGASGMRESFIGSNAYYVMKNAACPVMIIPEGRKWTSFKHILFPLRSSFGTFKRYEYIKAIGSGSDTQVEVFGLSVDAAPLEENALQLMSKKVQGSSGRHPLHLAVNFSGEKNIAREVLERADRMQADLIVLSPTVDVINKQFFIGPFSQRIMHQAKVPVLYVR